MKRFGIWLLVLSEKLLIVVVESHTKTYIIPVSEFFLPPLCSKLNPRKQPKYLSQKRSVFLGCSRILQPQFWEFLILLLMLGLRWWFRASYAEATFCKTLHLPHFFAQCSCSPGYFPQKYSHWGAVHFGSPIRKCFLRHRFSLMYFHRLENWKDV